MTDRIALCLEDLTDCAATRYVRCVALRGRQPGLGINEAGEVAWRAGAKLACELWVSADDQLILLRPVGGPPVCVERAGRSVHVPFGKPVVLLDQDVFETAGRRLRVHVHGVAAVTHPPSPLVDKRLAATLAATVALGVAALGCNRGDAARPPVEVRETPPAAPPPPDWLPEAAAPQGPSNAPDAAGPDASSRSIDKDAGGARDAAAKRDAAASKPPIEIRNHPPDPIN